MKTLVKIALTSSLSICLSTPLMAQVTQSGWSAADNIYDADEMQEAKEALQQGTGKQKTSFIQAERLEYRSSNNGDSLLWDMDAWYGSNTDKLWIKSEGHYDLDSDDFEEVEITALYSKAISPYFDLQAGIRHDISPNPSQTHAVFGLQGLAPYWFEVNSYAYISDNGNVTARVELEYELLLSQRLILQPRAELEVSFQDISQHNIASGFTNISSGLRLRYELAREFAPYIGVSWDKVLGDTATIAKQNGEATSSTSFVAGIRFWF